MASAIARPMPLVDPVMSAVLPASSFAIVISLLSVVVGHCRPPRFTSRFYGLALPLQNRRRGSQHLDVHNAILVVGRGGRGEAELAIEALEVALRADPDRAPRPELFQARHRLAHEDPPAAAAARRARRDDAADR